MLKTHYLKFLLLPFIALLLAACDSEPKEREAYNNFLNRQLKTPAHSFLSAPKNTVDSFGRYAPSYQAMESLVKTLQDDTNQSNALINKLSSFMDLQKLKSDWQTIDETKKEFVALADKQQKSYDDFISKIPSFNLPEDTQKLYDQIVSQKFNEISKTSELKTQFEKSIDIYKEIGQFLNTHADKIELRGSTPMMSDDKVLNDFNQLIDKLNNSLEDINKVVKQ